MDALSRARQVVAGMMAEDAFSQWLGLQIEDVQPGAVTVRMTVRADMLNGFGVCHGGVTFALADSAFAFASNTPGQVAVSIENNIAYPAKVVAGDVLTAKAEALSSSNRLATYQVMVTNQRNERVGIFRGTVYRTQKNHPGLEEADAES